MKRNKNPVERTNKLAEELEHALQEINLANNDRNQNRYAQIQGMINYGLDVAYCWRSGEKFPPRRTREDFI